jgi:hypothetical protein
MRLSRKGPPAIGFLLAGHRAIAGIGSLRFEGFAAKNAGLGLRVDPTLRPLKHPIDRSTAFVAAHDMLRRLSPPVADNRTTAPLAWFGPPPCAKVNPSHVGVGLGRAALGADLGDVAADARPRTVANRNPIDRVAGGHLPMTELALHALRVAECAAAVQAFIRNADWVAELVGAEPRRIRWGLTPVFPRSGRRRSRNRTSRSPLLGTLIGLSIHGN